MYKELVVARYRRDCLWTKNITFPVTVYNTSSDSIPPVPHINIPNTSHGLDVAVHIRHHIMRYDSLADYTIHGQDCILDHVLCSVDIRNRNYEWMCPFLNTFKPTVPFLILNQPVDRYMLRVDPSYHAGYPIHEVYKMLFKRDLPKTLVWEGGSHFIVSKEVVRSKPIAFWQKMIDMCYTHPGILPIYTIAHTYERLLYHIYCDPLPDNWTP